MLTRRSFIAGTGLAIGAATLPISFVGCSNSATIEGYVVKFAPLLTNILEIVAAATGKDTSGLQTKVTTDLASLEKLWTDYSANPNATTWEALNDIFTTVENDATTVFALVQISDPATQSEAMVIVTAAQGIFAILETLFPAAPATVTKKVSERKFASYLPQGFNSSKRIDATNVLIDRANSALKVKTSNPKVDGLKLNKVPHVGKRWML
jgi:hypothetical protein